MILSNSPLPSFPHKCADTLALTHITKQQGKVCVFLCGWMFWKGRLMDKKERHLIRCLSLFTAPLWIFEWSKSMFFFYFLLSLSLSLSLTHTHTHMHTHTLSGSSLAEVSSGMLGWNGEAPGHLGLTVWTVASCVFVCERVCVCVCVRYQLSSPILVLF